MVPSVVGAVISQLVGQVELLIALGGVRVQVFLESASTVEALIELYPLHDLSIVGSLVPWSVHDLLESSIDVRPASVFGVPHDARVCLDVIIHLLLDLMILNDVGAVVVVERLTESNVRIDEHWEFEIATAVICGEVMEHFWSYPHGWTTEQKSAGTTLFFGIPILMSLPLADSLCCCNLLLLLLVSLLLL